MNEGRLGMIDARDIGEVAAKVLTEEGHGGNTYTLTGPAAFSFHYVAMVSARSSAKKWATSLYRWRRQKRPCWAGAIPEWQADALNEYAGDYSEGYSDWTTGEVERLTGHAAT